MATTIEWVDDSDGFLQYASAHYNNPSCMGIQEFLSDVRRFRYVAALLGNYRKTGKIKINLVINHLICLHNVFGLGLIRLIFFQLHPYPSELKTFLEFLNYLPPNYEVSRGVLESSIDINKDISSRLRKI